ncbi:ABC transporter substrate-binding protein [Methylocapsa sp. S129]|uniref:ABC transporter substrate-binding protein n=1 Tax=Methylocapsa sp. S129 TaxID=1641869 RepID=UPI00131D27CE|nr:ABC transporter substrate-binding protein [Methylocapsa sp. S129]
MTKLQLSVAIGDYDRMRPLVDGAVKIDAVDPQFMLLEPEEIFFRAFRRAEFDICELSLSSYCVQVAAGGSPYIAAPVFPSRAFRHSSVYIRDDRNIANPADLKGKRIGLPEYQLTANVWVRLFLNDDHGVAPSDISWVRGGYDDPRRVEKIPLSLPANVRLEDAPEGKTISGMLAAGELDAIIGPRAPSCFRDNHPNIRRLFADPQAAGVDWFKRTRIFPIMHLIGIRRSLADAHPWLPFAIFKAFERSKAIAIVRLDDSSAAKATLPFIEEQLQAARALMGDDFWSYGLAPNRHVLERFLRQHHEEGLSARLLAAEELFHPSTLEAHRI